MAPHDLIGQAQFVAHGPHLVFEQVAQRLYQLEVHLFGDSAHVVVALDLGRRIGARLDDIGIQRALHQIGRSVHLIGGLLEDANEQLADDLALLLGVDHPHQSVEEPVGGVHRDQLDALGTAEGVDHLLAFVLAHQAGVDEHASELMAHCPVD